ncbi:BREX-1 system phosphatase PglZ type A [Flammeovirgaceae bacterium SG7u.111]|nr:BREX-1 system phosphatase PglZ type A [Flammeovirgaceae bacterium SG7u.132]WPO34627.1 BREX-1 system phosphatase PglZ type A [Flammeovirgaceae bacterium SG7u.111]
MKNNITKALEKNFEQHRIIFWYDEKGDLKEEFDQVALDDVTKIHVEGNEFEVKHLVSQKQPAAKFLLYFDKEKPRVEENWLLDLELANFEFHTDQEAMFLQELGLDFYFKELVATHIEFFKNKERRLGLKGLLGEGDTHKEIRYKMLAVVFESEHVNLNTFLHKHASLFLEEDTSLEKSLDRFCLSGFYWGELKAKYNYQGEPVGIYDFMLEAFMNNFELGKKTGLTREAGLMLSLWQDSYSIRDSFKEMSAKIAADTQLESLLSEANLDQLIDDNLFELTEQRVIHELVGLIVDESISKQKTLELTKLRENKFWYAGYKNFYDCLKYAVELMDLVKKNKEVTFASREEGIRSYTQNLYQIDYVYRKFVKKYRDTHQSGKLKELADKVEKVYSNDWLLASNNEWQSVVDKLEKWQEVGMDNQKSFYNIHVAPYLEKKQRLFVIISDAFRYECGVEFHKQLLKENRYDAELGHLVTNLPSYTQLGMASLLPHKNISFKEKSDSIMVDGTLANGISGRKKVLAEKVGARATAIQADEFVKLKSSTEGRDFVKGYDLIYIYHNRIDKQGDDKSSEEQVFDAVEEEIDFLKTLLKKIASMNGNNMILTSDHGFIYQNQPLEESDFCQVAAEGEVWKENRRFILGKELKPDVATKYFSSESLGLAKGVDVLIPKGINRNRVKGAGSRFIHGGSSLQETIVPLIKISKRRKDTIDQVEIDIIQSTNKITTNIQAISFIQNEPVSDKSLPRSIKAGFYAGSGELISNLFKFNFDFEGSLPQQREEKHRFQLSSKASGQYKNQQVFLRLEEPVAGSSQWKPYKEYSFTLNISFTSDFDDF